MIRAYKSDPVPEEKIRRLLTYAVRAPSAGNLQPWEFIVVKSPETRAKLAKAAFDQTSVASAPVIIAACTDIQRAGSKYGARGSFYSLVDTAFVLDGYDPAARLSCWRWVCLVAEKKRLET